MRAKWSGVLRSPVGASAAVVLCAVLVLAVLAPLLWSDRAGAVDTGQILQGSSARHWMGTDGLGRDVFYRVLVATRLSVELALAATAIGVVAGLVLGTAPVLFGARVGRFVHGVVSIAVAFPGLLLALFFAVIFGVGTSGGVLAIGLAAAPGFARLTQTLVARVSALDYVAAARIAGVGRVRLLLRHVLPNIGEPLVVNATIAAGGALLSFAGLSFLGLGVQAPDYDWGRLLGEGLNSLYVHPGAALAPTVAVVVAGLAFNLFGEAIAKGLGQHGPQWTGTTGEPDSTAAVPGSGDTEPVLAVEGLRVSFPGPDGPVTPVREVSFTLARGECVGVVGESGSGKSLTALAVAQLVEDPGRVHAHAAGVPGDQPARPRRARRPATARHLVRDGVPGPDDVVQPDPAHRRAARRGRAPATRAWDGGRRSPARSTGCARSGYRPRSGARASSRTSSRAGCGSGR